MCMGEEWWSCSLRKGQGEQTLLRDNTDQTSKGSCRGGVNWAHAMEKKELVGGVSEKGVQDLLGSKHVSSFLFSSAYSEGEKRAPWAPGPRV